MHAAEKIYFSRMQLNAHRHLPKRNVAIDDSRICATSISNSRGRIDRNRALLR
jgi:hypothetical protein